MREIKAIMVDVDGVLVVHPDPQGWSANLERDLGLAGERLQRDFFAPHWPDVVCGRARLHERLAAVLARIAPHLTAEALCAYWFAEDAHLDHDLLAQLDAYRAGGVEVHLATLQEHERASYLMRQVGLGEHVDAIHYSAELGCAKPEPEFFRRVEARSGFRGADIFFIDDRPANVEAARAQGWLAALWTGDSTVAALLVQAAGG